MQQIFFVRSANSSNSSCEIYFSFKASFKCDLTSPAERFAYPKNVMNSGLVNASKPSAIFADIDRPDLVIWSMNEKSLRTLSLLHISQILLFSFRLSCHALISSKDLNVAITKNKKRKTIQRSGIVVFSVPLHKPRHPLINPRLRLIPKPFLCFGNIRKRSAEIPGLHR